MKVLKASAVIALLVLVVATTWPQLNTVNMLIIALTALCVGVILE